jgi:polyhydroxyalkanoate synthesis regulator phasin
LWGWLGGGVLGFALCAALLGGTAFAASSATSTDLGQAFIDKLAQNLGISSADLQTKIKESGDATVDDAVTNGQLTQEQGDRLKQRFDSGAGVFDFGRAFGMGPGCGLGMDLDTLASTLGLTTDQLQTQLRAGTSLTDIITNQGKTVDEVVTALVAAQKTTLDQAVTDGKLTQAQEDQILNDLPARLTDMIDNGHFGGRHGGPWGMPGDQATPNATPDTSATPDSGV